MKELIMVYMGFIIYLLIKEFFIVYKNYNKEIYIFNNSYHSLQHISIIWATIILIIILLYNNAFNIMLVFLAYIHFILLKHFVAERLWHYK